MTGLFDAGSVNIFGPIGRYFWLEKNPSD